MKYYSIRYPIRFEHGTHYRKLDSITMNVEVIYIQFAVICESFSVLIHLAFQRSEVYGLAVVAIRGSMKNQIPAFACSYIVWSSCRTFNHYLLTETDSPSNKLGKSRNQKQNFLSASVDRVHLFTNFGNFQI